MEIIITIKTDLSVEDRIDLINKIADIIVGEYGVSVENYDIIENEKHN